jgi:DNA-binding SARP family transcriptional activator
VVIVVLLVEPHHADVSCHPTAIRLSTATRRHSLHQRPQEAGVRFRVLGPVEVRNVDDRTVELGERPRRLLAVLLANANRVVGVDAIADAVWGATSPANPGQAVQTVVSRLRGRLGADVIETRAPGYRLVATADDLDALALVDLLQRARETDDDQTAVDLIGGALALPRGEPYAGFADEAWARAEAGRLAELLRTAVEERGQRLLEVGRATEAIPELEAFVAAQPLRERAQALLMRGLHRVGRQADALAAYRRYRETVADELGLEPSRELQELERAILTDTLSATPSAGSATAPGAPHWTAPTSLTPKLAYLERAPGERIAVATVGAGPPLVYPPSWVSRIDILTSGRDIRSGLLDRLARDFTVRVFDRYGTGLSRGELRDFSFEASVDEVLTVLDTLPEPAPLVAISSAGPIDAVDLRLGAAGQQGADGLAGIDAAVHDRHHALAIGISTPACSRARGWRVRTSRPRRPCSSGDDVVEGLAPAEPLADGAVAGLRRGAGGHEVADAGEPRERQRRRRRARPRAAASRPDPG